MSLNRIHASILASWFIAVWLSFGVRVAFVGNPLSPAESVLWLCLIGLPAVVVLAVFRGAPPVTIAQVLYETEQAPNRGNALPLRRESSSITRF